MEISIGRFCAECKFENDSNAKVCVNCQTPLNDAHAAQITTKRLSQNVDILTKTEIEALIDSTSPVMGLSIYIVNNGELIMVEEEQVELILGRKTSDTSETGGYLINIGAYDGFISRRHAKISRNANRYEIVDLGSSNGTWVNRQRLIPQKPYPLLNGSHIQMGHIQLMIHYAKNKPDSES
jgi:hypothetical protein